MPEDIRLPTNMMTHPKFRKLKRQLGAEGCLAWIALLCWIAENKPDGNLSGLSSEDLEMVVDWAGSKSLVKALAELKLLDGKPGSFRAHQWKEHQPYVTGRPERIAKARKAANAMWDRKRRNREAQPRTEKQGQTLSEFMPVACSEHAARTQDACTGNPRSTAPSPPFTSTPLTAQKQIVAAAFQAIGHEEPFGQARFQEKWIRNFKERAPDEWLTIVMERTIQECQAEKIRVPKPFYTAKRSAEDRDDVEFKNAHRRTPL